MQCQEFPERLNILTISTNSFRLNVFFNVIDYLAKLLHENLLKIFFKSVNFISTIPKISFYSPFMKINLSIPLLFLFWSYPTRSGRPFIPFPTYNLQWSKILVHLS